MYVNMTSSAVIVESVVVDSATAAMRPRGKALHWAAVYTDPAVNKVLGEPMSGRLYCRECDGGGWCPCSGEVS